MYQNPEWRSIEGQVSHLLIFAHSYFPSFSFSSHLRMFPLNYFGDTGLHAAVPPVLPISDPAILYFVVYMAQYNTRWIVCVCVCVCMIQCGSGCTLRCTVDRFYSGPCCLPA